MGSSWIWIWDLEMLRLLYVGLDVYNASDLMVSSTTIGSQIVM